MDYDGEEDNFLVDFDPFEHAEDDHESQEDEEMPKAPPEFNKVAKEFDIDLRYSRENNLQRRVRPDDVKVKIIQVVKDYPCLYDRKCEYFRNPSYTARAWNNVASRVRMSKDECRVIFTSLFREFAITYVILRDQKLVDEGLHRRKIFIYYDHMLFFRNQINVPMVRQNQVQAIVNGLNRNIVKKDNHRARREKNFDAKFAELVKGEKSLEQPATVLYEAEDIKETTTLTDVDLAYSKDNNLPAKILPDDFNVRVINAVKAYPCLYDRTSENFKNHTLKDHAWTDVAKMLNCESS